MSDIGSVADAEIYRRHADPGSRDRRLPVGTCLAIWIEFHIAVLARRFRLQTLPDKTVGIDPAVNLRMKKNLQMSIEHRDPAATS